MFTWGFAPLALTDIKPNASPKPQYFELPLKDSKLGPREGGQHASCA